MKITKGRNRSAKICRDCREVIPSNTIHYAIRRNGGICVKCGVIRRKQKRTFIGWLLEGLK